MPQPSNPPSRPELFFGLVGPIGCNIDNVQASLERCLQSVHYQTHIVSLSAEMYNLYLSKNKGLIGPRLSQPATSDEKISFGNLVRRQYKQNGILAIGALKAIRRIRLDFHLQKKIGPTDLEEQATLESELLDGHAFIIRQFKRPEETRVFSDLYGRQFVQVSITQDEPGRVTQLRNKLKKGEPSRDDGEIEDVARRLVRRDEHEQETKFGQRVGKIFHMGDVFIDANSQKSAIESTSRFIDSLFGRNDLSPSLDEFGSYIAKGSSMRSADLSRQVGAAILTRNGDLISIGCNEVPKPFGGNYREEDAEKHRDIDDGVETNKLETNRIIHNFLDTLDSRGLLNKSTVQIMDDGGHEDAIRRSMIGDITEYGRMVHAEMNALSDAARLGRRVEGATIYVTTFPCHNCAKHLIAAGIRRVVYIEPYPKSKTLEMYEYAMTTDLKTNGKVLIQHFTGISPRRFRDIFEKGKRRHSDGTIKLWKEGEPFPSIPIRSAFYGQAEVTLLRKTLAPT